MTASWSSFVALSSAQNSNVGPNMRVQRTRRPSLRSGRSRRSLGSPLTRYPLGDLGNSF